MKHFRDTEEYGLDPESMHEPAVKHFQDLTSGEAHLEHHEHGKMERALELACEEMADLNIHPADKCDTCGDNKGICRDINELAKCWKQYFITKGE